MRTVLYGRSSELEALEGAVNGVQESGSAVVLSGPPGIGKSSLLEATAQKAAAAGMTVLTTSGVQSEAELPFAGLHQLLRGLLDDRDLLPAPQRLALEAAFGMTDAVAPELFLIALATLELLGDAAGRAPLLLIVEDAHWLDRSTSEVLAFVARRVRLEPVVVLIAIRDDVENLYEAAGLSEIRVAPLDEASARQLLDSSASDLSPALRERLLAEAAGNPLALIELPGLIGRDDGFIGVTLPNRSSLPERLERAFAVRLSDLPHSTQTLLLVASADGDVTQAEALRATSIVEGTPVGVDALDPAVAARLVEADRTRIRFRHPLVSTAVYQKAKGPDRQEVHAALAQVLAGSRDRSVWHLAAAATGEDEGIALELEAVAKDAERRGSITAAVAALEQSAQLSGNPDLTPGRLLRAAEMALEVGRLEVAARLQRRADPLKMGTIDIGRLEWIREISDPGPPGEPNRMRVLLEIGSKIADAGDTALALRLFSVATASSFFADTLYDLSEEVVVVAEALSVDDNDPWLLYVLAYGAPIDRGATIIERVSRLVPDPTDPDGMLRICSAAGAVGAHDLAGAFARASIAGLRQQGRLRGLVEALTLGAWTEIHLGRWDVAAPDAEEAYHLAQDIGSPIWGAGAQAALSFLAGLRGEEQEAESQAACAEVIGMQYGARNLLSTVQLARGSTALGQGRHEEAYMHLRRMFIPTDPAYHHLMSSWAIGYLAEAAVHTNQRDEARAIVVELEVVAARTPSPWLQVSMRYARALLADDAAAESLFRAALNADLARWPFDRARLLLAYGAWLRTQRRREEARSPLRGARDVFDALGVTSWSDRTRQELRASGETSMARTAEARDQLSPQELQIARMAAAGLTNREIGQNLYLSHRTVGSHLYRIFPKLGITSRSQLRAVLATSTDSLI